MIPVRTRIAPSPTGYIHVGTIRTALFAWLLAKQNNGSFILRIEDTDQKREVAGADKHIMKSLHSLGLNYDEGPDVGGSYGPYYQSQRLDIYKKWAQNLINNGRAYADPYTQEQINEFREQAKQSKTPFLYRNYRPKNPPLWDGKTPLRFLSDPKSYNRTDAVLGDLKTGPEVIDDFILIKSDGFPTYNFAHIVDDTEMKISHIIRGQEFLASIPNYLNLYEALKITPPVMATMPHIMGPDGKKKLSKRDGAKDVLDYLRDGFIVEALINFIVSLGWNDGTEQEIFTVDELINKFSLDRVQKSGAKFDEERLKWMNGQWIRRLDLEDLYKRTQDFWPESAQNYEKEYKLQILTTVKERLKYLSEIPAMTGFFFAEPTPNLSLITNNKQLSKFSNSELANLLKNATEKLANTNFKAASIQAALNELLTETNQKPGVVFSLIRIATTWAPFSPSLPESLEILGQQKTLKRLGLASSLLIKN